MQGIEFRRPHAGLAPSYRAMRDACLRAGEDLWKGPKALAHAEVLAYVEALLAWSRGEALPPGWVAMDDFWIVANGAVVGELEVRRELTGSLREFGGNIGYSVHPAYRGRGIATAALREGLRRLSLYGLAQALLTVSEENAASIRVIEKCAGRRLADARGDGPARRRYALGVAPCAVRLRPLEASDVAFAERVYFETQRWIVERLFGWRGDRIERAKFFESFDAAAARVVVVDGCDAGWIEAHATAESVELQAIYLLPPWQGRGIGTALVRALIAQAGEASLPLLCSTAKINPARSLYERMGFVQLSEDRYKVYLRHPCEQARCRP